MADFKTKNCPECGRIVPALEPSELAFSCVLDALRRGSSTLASAEIVSLGEATQDEANAWVDHLRNCIRAYPFAPEIRAILDAVDGAFANVEKPDHFTDYNHCEECREHDEALRGATRETISREALGGSGWDPMCFVDGQGFAYYFPAMARYALAPDLWGGDAYIGQFIFHVGYEKEKNRHLKWFSAGQRKAAVSVMEQLLLRGDISDYEKQQLDRAKSDWSAF